MSLLFGFEEGKAPKLSVFERRNKKGSANDQTVFVNVGCFPPPLFSLIFRNILVQDMN